MQLLREMLTAMSDPQMRHAAAVHQPIALALLGVPLLAALLLTRGRSLPLRWTALVAYALLLAGAFVATQSGEAARGQTGVVNEVVAELIEEHEEMGERVWVLALLVLAAVAAQWLRPRWAAPTFAAVALVLALAAAGWVGVTGHLGGTLVYEHGLGAPRPAASAAHPAPSDPSTALTTASGPSPAADPRVAFFEARVFPLLEESCIGCHGGGRPKGGLDLTSSVRVLRGGESGPAVVPGRPEESLLLKAVTWEVEGLRMPFREDQLPPDQIDVLRQWIRDGAVWSQRTD